MPARKHTLNLRAVMRLSLPPDTGRLIAKAAAVRHQSKSAFLRDAAVEKANRVLGIEHAEIEALTA